MWLGSLSVFCLSWNTDRDGSFPYCFSSVGPFPLLALDSARCLIQDKYLITVLCVKLHLLLAHFLLEWNTAEIPIAIGFHLFRAELTSLRLFQPNRGKQSLKLAEDEAYLIAIQRWFSVLLLGDKQAWAGRDAGCISSASVGGTPVPC